MTTTNTSAMIASTETLTRGQKAAATRAANKLAKQATAIAKAEQEAARRAAAEARKAEGKMPIPNVAAMSAAALAKKLRDLGVELEGDESKGELITIAKDEGFWDYKGDIVPKHFKQRYGAAQNCGDDVASHLVGCEVEDLQFYAEQNGIDFHRWDHCNRGQLTMNLGNVLRGRIKRGERVVIGGAEWNAEAN